MVRYVTDTSLVTPFTASMNDSRRAERRSAPMVAPLVPRLRPPARPRPYSWLVFEVFVGGVLIWVGCQVGLGKEGGKKRCVLDWVGWLRREKRKCVCTLARRIDGRMCMSARLLPLLPPLHPIKERDNSTDRGPEGVEEVLEVAEQLLGIHLFVFF